MAKPNAADVEAIYAEAEAAGLSRTQVDDIARPLLDANMQQAWRGLGDARSTGQLDTIARAVRQSMRPISVDTATGEIGPEPKATAAQVDYIANLLAERVRSGDGGGFFATGAFLTRQGSQTRIDMDAVRSLTRKQASNLIDSLKGNY